MDEQLYLREVFMSTSTVTLRNFSESELIFDEAETKHILKFFFQHLQHRIDPATVSTELRNFAQGLLVEAVDATYALGFIEIIWRTSYNPGNGMLKALSKIGRRAARHWFKHASPDDLLNAKISSRVRDQLALSFASVFSMMLEGIARAPQTRRTHIAHVRYGELSKTDRLWG